MCISSVYAHIFCICTVFVYAQFLYMEFAHLRCRYMNDMHIRKICTYRKFRDIGRHVHIFRICPISVYAHIFRIYTVSVYAQFLYMEFVHIVVYIPASYTRNFHIQELRMYENCAYTEDMCISSVYARRSCICIVDAQIRYIEIAHI